MFEQYITRKDDSATCVDEFNRCSTRHVAGGVQNDLDLIVSFGVDLTAFIALGDESFAQFHHVTV